MSKYAHLTSKWVEEYNAGQSFREIGKKYNVSKATVKRNIAPYIEQRPLTPTKKYASEWKELYESGWNAAEIARKYKVTVGIVTRRLEELNVVLRAGGKRGSKYDKYLHEWVDLYQNKGKSLKEISDIYGCAIQTVSNIITQKIDTRSYSESSRKYEINDTYFTDIDSKEKAYWLGYVFASGSLIPRVESHAIQVVCNTKDESQVQAFLDAISSASPVMMRNDNMAYARVFSKTMFHDLERHGLLLNKLYLLEMPSLSSIEYMRSFVLGYFDGKATFGSKRPFIIVSGTLTFLEQLDAFIQQELGFSLGIVPYAHKEYDYDRYKISTYSKYKIIVLLRWLYQDQPVAMQRHKDIYHYYEEEFNYDEKIINELINAKNRA